METPHQTTFDFVTAQFYMCQCTDLLQNNSPCVIDDDHRPLGLTAVELTSPNDCVAFMAEVRARRTSRSTQMNVAGRGHAGSSRSHCSLILVLRQVVEEEEEEETARRPRSRSRQRSRGRQQSAQADSAQQKSSAEPEKIAANSTGAAAQQNSSAEPNDKDSTTAPSSSVEDKIRTTAPPSSSVEDKIVVLRTELHIMDMAGAERPSSIGTEHEIALKAVMDYYRGKSDITVGGQGYIVNFELFGLRSAVVWAAAQHRKRKKLVIPKALGLGTSFSEYASGCFSGEFLLAMIVTLSPAPSCGWETWFSCTYGEDLAKLCCPVRPQKRRNLATVLRESAQAAAKSAAGVVAAGGAGSEGAGSGGAARASSSCSAGGGAAGTTSQRAGAAANKYLFKRKVKARHDARELELWQKLWDLC